MKRFFRLTFWAAMAPIFIHPGSKAAEVQKYPEWAKNAVIYEVNIRQHTVEGTFQALEKDLPRLKSLGVDILWLMPINPIGQKNRKGKLGSYYSVMDYKKINPEYGTEEDFNNLVKAIHKQGMKVIIDWVANHTSWDNPWLKAHPDWYQKDSTGKILSPYDWTDVISLNYKNKELRVAMTDAMEYWVKTSDIDGFRCDVAGLVPVDFWEEARTALEKIKPMFMLAEDEDKPELCNKAFDMNYGWRMHHLMHQVAKAEMRADTLIKYQTDFLKTFPTRAIKMNFTTNHDENSWNGTVVEKFGLHPEVFSVLCYTFPGMPLLYSGQEAKLNKRLRFFEKDTIDWSNKELVPFYQKLNKLRHETKALWSPPFGGTFKAVGSYRRGNILSFQLEKDRQIVFVILNLSGTPCSVVPGDAMPVGKFKEYFSGRSMNLAKDSKFSLQGWSYQVFISE